MRSGTLLGHNQESAKDRGEPLRGTMLCAPYFAPATLGSAPPDTPQRTARGHAAGKGGWEEGSQRDDSEAAME